MANFTLTAQTPLRGYKNSFGHTSLREIQDVAIYSIALAQTSDSALKSIETTLGAPWPKIGFSSKSSDSLYQLLGLQADQIFVLVHKADAEDGQAAKLPTLDEAVYVTDQSDGWAGLRIEGPGAIAALERSCPIDLHHGVFTDGQLTRTTMEHLSVVIMRESEHAYLLLSPASSAESFSHMLETSLRNTLG